MLMYLSTGADNRRKFKLFLPSDRGSAGSAMPEQL